MNVSIMATTVVDGLTNNIIYVKIKIGLSFIPYTVNTHIRNNYIVDIKITKKRRIQH